MSKRIEGEQEDQQQEGTNVWLKFLRQNRSFTPSDLWSQYVKLADDDRKQVFLLASNITDRELSNGIERRVSYELLAMKKGTFWTEEELLEIKHTAEKKAYRHKTIPVGSLNSTFDDHATLYLEDLSNYLNHRELSLSHLCLPSTLMFYLKINGYETIPVVESTLSSGELENLTTFGAEDKSLLSQRLATFHKIPQDH